MYVHVAACNVAQCACYIMHVRGEETCALHIALPDDPQRSRKMSSYMPMCARV